MLSWCRTVAAPRDLHDRRNPPQKWFQADEQYFKICTKGVALSGRSGGPLDRASRVWSPLGTSELAGTAFLMKAKGSPQATVMLASL